MKMRMKMKIIVNFIEDIFLFVTKCLKYDKQSAFIIIADKNFRF